MADRELLKREAFTVWMSAVKHADNGAHRPGGDLRATELDIAYWRAAEAMFDIWWTKMTRGKLRR